MRVSGRGEAQEASTGRTGNALSYVVWQTESALMLPVGLVWAYGDASPQVRNPGLLAEVGDAKAQIEHIRRVIVESLSSALIGMEATVDDLRTRRDEITSLTLVTANRDLASAGVMLLELRITALNCTDG